VNTSRPETPMRQMASQICLLGFVLFLLSGCVTFAAPLPVATLGGPATAPPGASELALAVGSGSARFPGGSSGGLGWMTRWRHSLVEDFDLGVDVMGVDRQSKMTITGKGALRIRLVENMRLELGLGAANDSDGKSLGADVALIGGTVNAIRVWNFYGGVRGLGALSVTVDERPNDETGVDRSPSALLYLAIFGAQARLDDWATIVFEGGVGRVHVGGSNDVGLALYGGAGVVFVVGAPSSE
jgi:hypothetical protein